MKHVGPPAPWVVEHRHLLPASGRGLDVACGRGRHAFWLAAQGFVVRALDRERTAVESVRAEARRLGLPIGADQVDLEVRDPALGRQVFDVVVGVHYLYRPLFPHLIDALRPGGVLIYETFTRDQALRGQPTNPAFLLESGELEGLVAPLQMLAAREGDFDGRCVASIVARRSGAP